ncbi:MAG: hypothetical protein ACI4A5_03770, partial [Hominilimicola sp.]
MTDSSDYRYLLSNGGVRGWTGNMDVMCLYPLICGKEINKVHISKYDADMGALNIGDEGCNDCTLERTKDNFAWREGDELILAVTAKSVKLPVIGEFSATMSFGGDSNTKPKAPAAELDKLGSTQKSDKHPLEICYGSRLLEEIYAVVLSMDAKVILKHVPSSSIFKYLPLYLGGTEYFLPS